MRNISLEVFIIQKESRLNGMINHVMSISGEPNYDSHQLWDIFKAKHNKWKVQCQNHNLNRTLTQPQPISLRIIIMISHEFSIQLPKKKTTIEGKYYAFQESI